MKYIADTQRYDRMIYNQCGKSGLKIPAISLGLWHNYGAADDYENCRAMIRRAFDLGITYFDIANNYGPPQGAAEATFGEIMKDDFTGHRDEMIITTKAGYRMWEGPYGDGGSRKYLIASLDQSLKRLGVDYVDVFFSHHFDKDTPLEETMEALHMLVRQGKALYIGLSAGYNSGRVQEALAILKRLGTPCTVHMTRYSMFERALEGDLQRTLQEEGVGSVAYCPLAEGLLTDKYLKGIPEGSRAARRAGGMSGETVTGEKIEKVRALQKIASERRQSLAQMALAWVLRGGYVNSALIGASRVGQIEENMGALSCLEFAQEELNKIEEILR